MIASAAAIFLRFRGERCRNERSEERVIAAGREAIARGFTNHLYALVSARPNSARARARAFHAICFFRLLRIPEREYLSLDRYN